MAEGVRARSGPIQVAVLRVDESPTGRSEGGPGNDQAFRVCVVAGRGFRGAVARNRARRRLRGSVWRVRDAFEEGAEYVVIGRPGVETLPAGEIDRRLRGMLGRLRERKEGGAEDRQERDQGDLPARRRARMSVGLLRLYQRAISPLLGAHCRFRPSCSQYAVEALQTYGFARGWLMAFRRVARCHPWSEGGHDPVPVARGK